MFFIPVRLYFLRKRANPPTLMEDINFRELLLFSLLLFFLTLSDYGCCCETAAGVSWYGSWFTSFRWCPCSRTRFLSSIAFVTFPTARTYMLARSFTSSSKLRNWETLTQTTPCLRRAVDTLKFCRNVKSFSRWSLRTFTSHKCRLQMAQIEVCTIKKQTLILR